MKGFKQHLYSTGKLKSLFLLFYLIFIYEVLENQTQAFGMQGSELQTQD